MSNGSINASWVAKRYNGEKAKVVASHVREGIGYFELESGSGYIIVAFRAVHVPEDASVIIDQQRIASLERRLLDRQGSHSIPKTIQKAMPKAVQDTFFKNRKDLD